jgi:hypothetical protein
VPPRTTRRPLTDEERARLAPSPVPRSVWWSGLVSGACVFALAFLLVLLASRLLPVSLIAPLALAIGLLAAGAWYAGIQRRERRAIRRWHESAARDLAAGHVESTIYQVADAVAVEEAEDEGLGYYLLLDDGRTLFLFGQYLWEPAGAGFPWASFEIERLPISGGTLRVLPHGAPLAPSVTRRPFSDRELQPGVLPEDGAIVELDFARLKAAGGRR